MSARGGAFNASRGPLPIISFTPTPDSVILGPMAFEAIQRLQAEFTDKYVIVSDDRPELVRFEGVVGQVKTINMSGRALVEFTGYLNNPGWHDIELAALKVVDKPPEPEPTAKKKAKPASKVPAKPAAGGKSAADVLAAVRGGAGKAPAAKKDAAGRSPKKASPSVGKATSDILAAARGGSSKAKPAAAEPKANKTSDKKTSPSVGKSTADILAAARGKEPAPEPPPTKPTSKKKPSGMTTEEILAAARAKKQPAEETPKPSAMDELEAAGSKKPEPRRKLSAEDIRNIGLGKLSIHRDPTVATEPIEKKDQPEAGDNAKPAALPDKVDHTKLTAAEILALGVRK